MMLKILMPKATFTGADAADALALAICHAHNRGGARMRMAKLAG
jgi:crossover junction endodeoxyribonuclease RuvC